MSASREGPAAVRIEHVCKNFPNGVAAVAGVSLEIGAGEFFALLGPSGCGKTTLLRMIAGLEAPTSGGIAVAGVDVTHTPPHKRPVNMVFQQYALFPHMTVERNVAFGLRYRGIRGAEADRRVAEALELVRLPGYGSRKPDQLSGGQRQRVALARALVLHPQVLLLDEPFGALDQKLRREMQAELKRLQRALGITFVFVTHDQEEALTMSDRIAVMNHGKVEQADAAEAVFERPRTRFVAEFMGAANFLDARRVVRPEKLKLALVAVPEMECLGVTIEDRTYQGVNTIWTVRTSSGDRLTSLQPSNDALHASTPFQPGDKAFACWSARHAITLDGDAT